LEHSKGNENTKRLRYIRVLEKFFYSIVNYLKKAEEPTKEALLKRILNNRRNLDKIEKLPLYKAELVELENISTKILSIKEDETTIDEISKDILQSANKYEQNINQKRYKKDKHSKKKFDDFI
jgi:hypothetical protein